MKPFYKKVSCGVWGETPYTYHWVWGEPPYTFNHQGVFTMAIVSKRNKPLIVIQIILSLVMVVALMVLTLGNLAILPTEENERMEYYADLFYNEYALCERTELGASVDLGFIPLWEDLFELLPQWLSLSLEGKALDDLPSEGIQQCKGLLFITFLIKEATVTALYEGVAYLGLLLAFLLIPIFLLICLIVPHSP